MKKLFSLLHLNTIQRKLWVVVLVLGAWVSLVMYNILAAQFYAVGLIDEAVNKHQVVLNDALKYKGKLNEATTALSFFLITSETRYKKAYQETVVELEERLLNFQKLPAVQQHERTLFLAKDMYVDLSMLDAIAQKFFLQKEDKRTSQGDSVGESIDLVSKELGPLVEDIKIELEEVISIHQAHVTLEFSEVIDELHDAAVETIIFSIVGAMLGIVAMLFVLRLFITPVNKIANAMRMISERGDLSQSLEAKGRDEYYLVAKYFNAFVAKIHTMVDLVVDSSRNLTTESENLCELSKKSHHSASQQHQELEKSADDLTNIMTTVDQILNNTNETLENAQDAEEHATKGKEVMTLMVDKISTLAQRVDNATEATDVVEQMSHDIGDIVGVITKITEQTNLLALNAAIEAARAGEQGRGFAVVADEVRALSSQVYSQTDSIQQRIGKLQDQVNVLKETMHAGQETSKETVEKANEASSVLLEITGSVDEIIQKNRHIVEQVNQHQRLVVGLKQNIENIDHIASSTATTSGDAARLSTEFTFLAKQLEQLVGQFKMGAASPGRKIDGNDKEVSGDDIELF